MKLNKIFMALAATAFVACSSEDLSDFSANQAPEQDSRLIELDPNFAIAGVGVEGNVTRTHWEFNAAGALVNKFLPIWDTAPAGGNTIDADADLEAQAVGLCWLGQGAVGTDVYTNYQFYHFGWLNNGETKAEFECNKLTNGSLYDEIKVAAGDLAGDEADETNFTLPPKSATAGLNYNSGVYKTDNKAIFGGQYIVYYPFNEDFKDAGTIPALAETTFSPVSTAFDTPEIGHATFRYSAPVTIEGGDQAADFGLKNLSALVQLRVATPTSDAVLAGVETIDQIVLYSPSQKLLKQANLAADQIVAGKKGAELYASTEGTKTIVANFAAPGVTLQKTNSTTPVPTSAFITVLPTTVDDLVVLVHSNSLGQWATVNVGNYVFEAGKAKRMDITVAAADFKSDYIAVDEASLTTALKEARAAVTADPTATPEIAVIGDITLATSPYIINAANDANITIKGDALIVPEDVILRVNTNMESDIRVLGKSCCNGKQGGILSVFGGTISNVTMEPTEAKVTTPALYDQYNPTIMYQAAGIKATIAAGKTIDVQAGNVNVNNAVDHKGAINVAEGAKVTVSATGDLQFMGSTVVNDGTIEVLKGGKYDMTDANGNATAADGKRMTNNGTFIHNVDAGVGTAVQSMAQNGEYRCRVDDQVKLADAYLQWTACSVIEMVNAGFVSYNLGVADGISYKHNNKFIDIEVNSGALTQFNNNGTTGTPDNKTIQTGKLTVIAGGLDVDFVRTSGSTTGKRALIVNGDMVVKAATTFTDTKAITLKENLTVEGAILTYAGAKKNEGGFAIAKDVTVDAGWFDAGAVNALNITSANFYLKNGGLASFGNRTEGDAHNLDVTGTISNPAGCTFDIIAANQVAGSVLAWVTCSTLNVGGTFTNARPRVK